jgi:hypothetical protein
MGHPSAKTTLRRRSPSRAAARARMPLEPPDLDPTDQIHSPRVKPPNAGQPSLDRTVLQRKPCVSLVSQTGPSTVIVFSQIGPVFFVLAQEV